MVALPRRLGTLGLLGAGAPSFVILSVTLAGLFAWPVADGPDA